ncbi:MAG: glycosyltransferase [Anaerolineae bacterium]|nr:glycosyltransferase [Anaerolineae bacterium]
MHILHVTPYYAPAYAFGGVVRAVDGLARALVTRGHRITVLTTDALDLSHRSAQPANETRDGVHIVRVPNRLYALRRFNLSTPLGIGRQAEALLADVDVVHLHEFRTVENLLVAPRAAQAGVPVVLSPHGTLDPATGRGGLKQWWDRLLSPALMRHIDAVVGLHTGETALAQAFWHAAQLEARFETIPNGVDTRAINPDLGKAFRARWGLDDAVVCLFLGRLHARKGVEALARAFTRLAAPDFRLVIAGPDEGLLTVLQSVAVADRRIVLTGFLKGDARLGALAAADCFALPATGEGLSMAMLEAAVVGLPLLLAPGCNFPEAERAGAALIVEPEVEALTTALTVLLTDSDLRQRMGTAAQALVRGQFAWPVVAARWERIYEALGTPPSAPTDA